MLYIKNNGLSHDKLFFIVFNKSFIFINDTRLRSDPINSNWWKE